MAMPRATNARTYDMECLRQVLNDHPDSVAEQESAWRMLTRRSRASFFRWKRALMQATTSDDGKTEPNAAPESVVCVGAT